MKAITISKRGATIQHDAVVALTLDGNPVFILPANLPTPQLAVHPEGMIVYSVPEQEFPRYAEQLLASKEQWTFRVYEADEERLLSPQSGLRAHGLDLTLDQDRETG
jgi:hypothetical protein